MKFDLIDDLFLFHVYLSISYTNKKGIPTETNLPLPLNSQSLYPAYSPSSEGGEAKPPPSKDPSRWSVDEVVWFIKDADPQALGPHVDLFRKHVSLNSTVISDANKYQVSNALTSQKPCMGGMPPYVCLPNKHKHVVLSV